MRSSLTLLTIVAYAFVAVARAQTAAPAAGATQPTATGAATAQTSQTPSSEAQPSAHPSDQVRATASQPAVAAAGESGAAHPSRRSPSRHVPSQGAPDTARVSARTGKADGVLALGATDITGNKELPKVMVIVPWKDSLGTDGVIKPSDSLMDEVLGPVDRGVFQRQIRYYGQLNAGQDRTAAGRVAPVGDSH